MDKTEARIIMDKLTFEAQHRDLDHLYCVLSEEYQGEQSIETIVPSERGYYIVSNS